MNIEEAKKQLFLENIWCLEHDRPPLALTDPLSLTNLCTDYEFVDKKLYEECHYSCHAWTELPQINPCFIVLKENKDKFIKVNGKWIRKDK